MDIKENLHLISEADKCAFFEKVFREHHIALVNSDAVEEVKWRDPHWFRKAISETFSTLQCVAYQFGHYAIIWKGRSNIPVFLLEYELPFKLFSIGEYDFLLRKSLADGSFCFERYIWEPSEHAYWVEKYAPEVTPAEFVKVDQDDDHSRREHSWVRMYPHDDEETQSVDNRVFYDFIVKYWREE